MFVTLSLLTIGVFLIYIGAEFLVNSAVRIAQAINIRPFIIGATIVSFASSIPELSISLTSLYQGHAEIMLGNILGSNIANIALIIGVTSFIYPIKTVDERLNRELIVMILGTLGFIFLIKDGELERMNGIILFTGIVIYNLLLIHQSKIKQQKSMSNFKTAQYYLKDTISQIKVLFLLIIGFILLTAGAHLIVKSAADIAKMFGINKMVISISMISFATALPELGLAIVGALRRQTDLVLGNIIGSNIYNIFFVTGISVSIFPTHFSTARILINIFGLMIFTFFCAAFFFKNFRLTRLISIIMLIIYAGFITLIFQ